MPELSIVFVNYNDRIHLEKSLASLQTHVQDIDYEAIVVDNNSSDGSLAFLRKNFPSVKTIGNKENQGYAKANNQGIRESKGEYVLLLNTDTIINPGVLNLLLQEIKKNPGIGGIGPALLLGENNYQVSFGKNSGY